MLLIRRVARGQQTLKQTSLLADGQPELFRCSMQFSSSKDKLYRVEGLAVEGASEWGRGSCTPLAFKSAQIAFSLEGEKMLLHLCSSANCVEKNV